MRVFVTGSQGFVGTNLQRALVDGGHSVVEWDSKNSAGQGLLLPVGAIADGLSGCDAVIHLAANADVRDGWAHPTRDVEQNVVATSNLLEAMRLAGVRRLLFASSSSVYGDAPTPTRETWWGRQTSLYGASKLAGEGLIGAYVEAGHVSATVLRLTSMLGPHYRHGLVLDFYRRLLLDSSRLEVLGDGHTPRTRMDVSDGVAAFLHRLPCDPGWEVFNVGTDEVVTAIEVADLVAKCMGLAPPNITTGSPSWAGDHRILLDCTRLRAAGWEPRYSIPEGIERTVAWLQAQ